MSNRVHDDVMMESSSSHTVKLSDLLEHSHSMLDKAEAGEWEAVARDEVIRRELFDALFSKPSNLAVEAEFRKCIDEVLQINHRLEQLATHARDNVKAELTAIGEGRKAVHAYTEHSR